MPKNIELKRIDITSILTKKTKPSKMQYVDYMIEGLQILIYDRLLRT